MQGWFSIHKSTVIINHINGLENHTVIFKDAQKFFDKILHAFMIEVLERVGLEGTYSNKIRVIYDKATGNIILNGEKFKTMPLKFRNET